MIIPVSFMFVLRIRIYLMEKDEIECFSLINFVTRHQIVGDDRITSLYDHGGHLYLYETRWLQFLVMERSFLVVLGLPQHLCGHSLRGHPHDSQ